MTYTGPQSGLSTSPSLLRVDFKELDALTQFMSGMPGVNQKARNSAMGSIGWALKDKAKKATNSPNGLPEWPQITKLSKFTKVVKAQKKPRPYTSFSREESWQFQEEALSGATFKNPTGKGSLILRLWGQLASILVYTVDEETGELFFGFRAGTFGKKLAYTNAPTGTNGQWGKNNQPGRATKVFVPNKIGEQVVRIAKDLTEGFTHTIRSAAQQRYYAALGFPFTIGTTISSPARPLVGPVFKMLQPDIPALYREKFWASVRRNTMPDTVKIVDMIFGKTK